MKVALLCLARQGSKRIKEKNFKDFCGKPLIHHTLEVMDWLKYPAYVFTDFKEIKNYTKEHFSKIKIKNKPEEFAQDKHRTMDELRAYHKEIKADMYVLFQATSPLRFPPTIDAAIDIMKKNPVFKSGFSVYELPKKYYWMQSHVNFNQSERDSNGCEKQPLFVETGSFYIFKKEVLKEKHVIAPPWAKFMDNFIFDLDSEAEWQQAEFFYRRLEQMHKEDKKKQAEEQKVNVKYEEKMELVK